MEIGPYEVISEIASGGMGVVYRARDPRVNRLVAIKVLHGELFLSEQAKRRFALEAETLARVDHPHVVRVHDYDVTPQGPYLVLELLQGPSLRRRLEREGPFPVPDSLATLTSLCAAVQACHDAGVLHRDLKPDNVIVDEEGVLKLMDFGLVRDVDPATSRSRLSQAGVCLGTPGFWAPEQATGDLEGVGVRTDVYGLGATLFALLTAQPPHQGTLLEILSARGAVPPPSSINSAVPAWLDAVVARALAQDPARRFPSASALAAALAAEDAGQIKTRRGWVIAAALLSLLVVGGALAPRSATPAASPTTTHQEAVTQSVVALPRPTPEIARNAHARGLEHFAAGRHQAALEAFSKAIRAHPEFAQAYVDRALIRERQDDLPRALEDVARALSHDPNLAEGYRLRGLLQGRDWAARLADTQRALELDPAAPWAGQAKRELPVIAELVELQPALPPLEIERLIARAEFQADSGELKEALETCEDALALTPTAQAYRIRALVKSRQGDLGGAEEDLGRSIGLDPSYLFAYTQRCGLRRLRDNRPGALRDADRAILLAPYYPTSYYDRGELRYFMGDAEGAVADLTFALRLNSADPRVEQARRLLQLALEATGG